MKYSEYIQLNELLEAKGTTISKELGLKELNEAGEDTAVEDKPATVDTEHGHWFSKWGRLKSTLNKQGKKMQNQINKKVLAKYFPPLLKSEVDAINQINNLIAKNAPEREIRDVVEKYMDKTADLQEKQMNIIDNVIDKFLNNAGARLDAKIEASTMKEKNKIDLKNYWLLLKTQIRMNALAYMQKILTDKSKEALGGNAEAEKILNDIKETKTKGTTSWFRRKRKADETELATKKQEVTTAEAEMKTGEEKPVEAKTPEVGKKYKYTGAKGEHEGILQKDDKGNYSLKRADNKLVPIQPDKLSKLVPVEEAPQKPEGEREPKL